MTQEPRDVFGTVLKRMGWEVVAVKQTVSCRLLAVKADEARHVKVGPCSISRQSKSVKTYPPKVRVGKQSPWPDTVCGS